MCGISGFNGGKETLVLAMNPALDQRDPDYVSLDHRRLSIINLSELWCRRFVA